MVFRTVRSLGSALMIFSYSVIAFCSLPCCTERSAFANTLFLLKPKPNMRVSSRHFNPVREIRIRGQGYRSDNISQAPQRCE